MRILLVLLLLLSGCHKIRIENEFKALKNSLRDSAGADIRYDSCSDPAREITIRNQLAHGLSRDEAVKITLQNNPSLQADFDRLGIAKADLIQAGLYTNPQTTTLVHIPTKDHGPDAAQVDIESTLTGKLSDLWRVPLRTRIHEDELQIVTLRILTTILDLIEQTKSAYDSTVKANLQLENDELLLSFTKELRDEIYYRQGFGYSNELHKNNADAQVTVAQSAVINRKKESMSTSLHLTELLGISPTRHPIVLTDSIMESRQVPTIACLEGYTLENHPEILIARYKIKRYEDTVTFEKASIWKDVAIGVGYKQDFDKQFRGWGPAVDFEIPLFDTNYAQIAKAEFELERAKKKMRSKTIKVQREIRMYSIQAQQELLEIKHYSKKVIPSYEKSVDYTYTYAQTMQLTMLEALDSQLNLYRAKQELIEKYYNFHSSYNKLERAYGRTFISNEETFYEPSNFSCTGSC